MKFFITQLLIFLSANVHAQTGQVNGNLQRLDSSFEFTNLTVYLKKRDSTIDRAIPDSLGHFQIANLQPGVYSIAIEQSRNIFLDIENIQVFNDSIIYVTGIFPVPCKYLPSNCKTPKCTKGHTNNIIPVVYSMPSQEMMKKAKAKKIYLGGCIMSDCDPHFYCVVHKILL